MKTKEIQQNKPLANQTSHCIADSVTRVNLRIKGKRVTCSFKCNKKLWKTFVSTIKAQGLSVCHVLEPMILAYLTSTVYLSHTIRPLKIENLVIERAVKRIRRYAVEEEDEERCVYCGCKAAGRFRWVKTGQVFPLCSFHASQFVGNGWEAA
jgi:hypothetical protein